jgi:hypothetical protein
MNSKFQLSHNPKKPKSLANLGQPESIYSRNFRKSTVYIRFMQQSGDFTEDYLSSCRAHLTTLCSWLGDYSLCEINKQLPTFQLFITQMNISEFEKSKLTTNVAKFFLWAKSMYPNEFTTISLMWIKSLSDP